MAKHACLLLALAVLSAAGCTGPGDPHRPVDCEGITNTLAYFGPECLHFPNASPPCPYFSPPEAFAESGGPVAPAGSGCGCAACKPAVPPLTDDNLASYE